MMGNRGLFGSRNEPKKEFTEEELKGIEEYRARGERIKKLLIDFKDDSIQKIIGIVKECDYLILEEYEPIILNLKDPQKVVDFFIEEFEKKAKAGASSQSETSRPLLHSTLELDARRIKSLAGTVDMMIHYHSDRPQSPFAGLFSKKTDDKDHIQNSPEGDELRELARAVNSKVNSIYNNRPVPNDEDQSATALTYFRISRVRNFLTTLNDDRSRRSYLLKLRAAFFRKDDHGFIYRSSGERVFYHEKDFIFQLESEIETYNKILQINNFSAPEKEIRENNKTEQKEKRAFGGSQYQNLLVVHYLLKYLKAKDNKSAQARFASFLTGFSQDSFRNGVYNLLENKDFAENAEKVKKYFDDLNLTEISKMIENDIDSAVERDL